MLSVFVTSQTYKIIRLNIISFSAQTGPRENFLNKYLYENVSLRNSLFKLIIFSLIIL